MVSMRENRLPYNTRGSCSPSVPAFLDTDPVLYAAMIQLYRRGTARVIEERDDGVFIQDTHGITYMLAASDADLAEYWLKKYADENYVLMMLIGDGVEERVRGMLGLPCKMDTYQAVYLSDTAPEYDSRLRMVHASPKDVGFIREYYSNLDDDELHRVIKHRQLFLAYDEEDSRVGFIGQHMEGSMGMLEVLPEYQRKGYGTELESFMIAETLRQGLIPYCQFVTDNDVSRALQEKLGLKISDKVISWLY